MFMLLKKYILETKNGKIVILYEGNIERLSFNECFDMNDRILPRPFMVRNNKVFCSIKIQKNHGNVHKIICDEKIKFRDLKKHIPTIFNIKYIKQINKYDYLKANTDLIEMILENVVDKKEIVEIINSLRPGC